jgi:hypothetical protein
MLELTISCENGQNRWKEQMHRDRKRHRTFTGHIIAIAWGEQPVYFRFAGIQRSQNPYSVDVLEIFHVALK